MNENTTRRNFIKGSIVGVATVAGLTSPLVYQVGATSSGDVEIETDASVPSGTSIDLTTYEYLSGDTADNQQTVSVEDGVNTYVLDNLEAEASWDEDRNKLVADFEYQWNFELSSNEAQDATPNFRTIVVTIPQSWEFQEFDEDVELQSKPEDLELYYDQQELRTYQPLLVMENEARSSHKGMYGYVAKSADYDYDVYCYWVQYTHQGGLPLVNSDSHLGDHEPIYVYADKDTGEVNSVVYSGYHWFASELTFEEAPSQFAQERHSQHATHVKMKVVSPWHNYTKQTQGSGVFVPLNSWVEVRDAWAANGFYDPADHEAINNPITMQERDAWWAQGSRDAQFANLWRQLGLAGRGGADDLKADDGGGGGGGFWPF